MNNRFFTVMLLLVFLVTLTGNAQATSPAISDQRALVYVKLSSPDDLSRFATTRLPMYAMIEGGLLSGADRFGQQGLQEAGLSFQVVDPDIQAGTYYLAETRPSRPAPDFASYGRVLLNTSNGVLLRMNPSQVDALAQTGAELSLITLTPKPLPTAQSEALFPDVVDPDPLIQGMIDQVTTEKIYQYDRELAGELPVIVDGEPYTITTRYTYSSIPIQKTTSYVGQHMQDLGLDVEYHTWGGATYPNVIGEIPGLTNPDDIYIIGAHIDDVSGTPGADDNASGSVATLIAADILSQYQWGCTMRFAFWTGEEQGLNGSAAYAQRAYQNDENIVGYLNLDMIAWNTIGSNPDISLFYTNNIPPTLELAQLYADVVSAYDINLIPSLGTGVTGSDHASFWSYGFTSILAIEDFLHGDDNPYYHGSGDTPAHTDPSYFTEYVKASLATYAHMSGCLIPSGVGYLDGHVTAASDGPIEGATVIAEADPDHSFNALTDVSGYYTRTLLADTYTVTASAYSYLSSTITDVVITSDIATTQDFALTLAPTYTVSGTVTDSGTGLPLLAELSFTGSPVTVSSDPATGYYQAVLPQGNYIMHVTAPSHMPEDRPILVDHDQIQDFALDPLPCILLVDDDQNDPDVRSYFTSALNDLAYDYNVWDISTQGDPEEVDLGGYQHVLWTTGRLSSDTFTGANEAAVGAYLDAGGNFFLSSHEYLYNFGLTLFGTNYLGISSYQNDVQRSDVTGNVGNPIGDGLGPYSLIMPPGWLTNWSDNVSGPNSPFRWAGTGLNNSVNKEGETYRTVFFAWPFEGLSNLSARADVLGSVIDWFGGCEPPDSPIEGLTAVNDGPTQLGDTTTLTATVTSGTNVQYEWDFGDGITMTEQVVEHIYQATGTYTATVTATNGTSSASAPTTVTITDVPIEGLAAENNSPTLLGSTTTFTSTILSGSNVSYTWDFGDGITMTGQVVEHIYQATGTYTATVTATNSLGPMSVETVAIVYSNELPIYYYLSIVYK